LERIVQDNLERPYENRAFSTLYPPGRHLKRSLLSMDEENGGEPKEKDFQIDCNGRKNQYKIRISIRMGE